MFVNPLGPSLLGNAFIPRDDSSTKHYTTIPTNVYIVCDADSVGLSACSIYFLIFG